MFWADKLVERIQEHYKVDIEKDRPLLIRDEKTASGRVHVGSMRGVAIHGAISEVLSERGKRNVFKYEFNDMDPMDGFPVYLPEEFRAHMGKPLRNIPSPDGKAVNFAAYFAEEFKDVIHKSGWQPEFYNVSELYFSGQMDESIRIALTHAADIRRIYKEVSGSIKTEDWYPLQVICEVCGKVGTTRVTGFDGDRVTYRCEPNLVTWAQGCGQEGRVSPFGGKAKFPFKVEWPAKWKVLGVHIEGGGKDHSTKGGARDVANTLAKEVFKIQPPFDIPYEFFLVGGKKMSSSKGSGSSAGEISKLVPAHIFRLALLSKDPMQAFNFDPGGDTIPVLYDLYDKLAEGYWNGVEDAYARLFKLVHPSEERDDLHERFLPRFSQVAFLVQMSHLNLEEEVARLKGSALTSEDKKELESRARYARQWLAQYAPEKFKFELRESALPEEARGLSSAQKEALQELVGYIERTEVLRGEDLHKYLHDLKAEKHIEPTELFSALYLVFLGKSHGPKAGWFLSVLDRAFLISRLKEASL